MMTAIERKAASAERRVRLWPGVVAVGVQWFCWVVLPLWPQAGAYSIIGGVGGGLLVIAWWLFFSRVPWPERVGAIGLMIGTVGAASWLVHPSIANGMMGGMLPVYSVPMLSLALVGWAVATRHASTGVRYASLVAAIVLSVGGLTLVRTGGITGEADADLHWRWTPTPEERLLAQAAMEPAIEAPIAPEAPAAQVVAETTAPVAATPSGVEAAHPAGMNLSPVTTGAPRERVDHVEETAVSRSASAQAEWPGFRGPGRDGVVHGVRIATTWAENPPMEMWRRPIGPGWSSFAVQGDLLYTQEQRGEDEVVACYRVSTGEPVWQHRDRVRFWESNGGAGPRATPTLRDGRVYSMGAMGLVNALDAATGAVIWSRNAVTDTSKSIPDWGIAGSPLAVDDLVIVAVAGQLAAYDAATGATRWVGEAGGGGYSSPHLVTVDGVPQVLLLRGARTISVAPADGTLLWEHRWDPAVSIVQPTMVGDRGFLIASGDAMGGRGIRHLSVTRGSTGWSVEERWTTRGLKPYFNDFVAHAGAAFGFDGSILAAVDLRTGERKWKGGRYGHGQLLLLPDQDLLLILSEDGELATVRASGDAFSEVARIPVLNGKTWNHPAVVGHVLLVRNGEEMAAFRLPGGGS